MPRKITFPKIKYLNGFTLLEALIALLVLSVGLLGIAALQATTLKANHGTYQRTQAIFLAYDMMDRLRANRTAALAGNCDVVLGAVTLAGTNLCAIDVTDWLTNGVAVLLPTGQGAITCGAVVCVVTVQWNETRQGGTATAATAQIIFTTTAAL